MRAFFVFFFGLLFFLTHFAQQIALAQETIFYSSVKSSKVIDKVRNLHCIRLSRKNQKLARKSTFLTYIPLTNQETNQEFKYQRAQKRTQRKLAARERKLNNFDAAATATSAFRLAKKNLSQIVRCLEKAQFKEDNDDKTGSSLGELGCELFGSSSASSAKRIINGTFCEWGDSPIVGFNIGFTRFCSGAVFHIDSETAYVLTAAHCFAGFNFQSTVPGAQVVIYQSSEVTEIASALHIHPLFSSSSLSESALYDIAILEFPLPFYTDRFISLGTNASEFVGKSCYISGFGRLGITEQYSYTSGFELVFGLGNAIAVNDEEVSFQFLSTTSDSNVCAGDSGGPLVCCDDLSDLDTCAIVGPLSAGNGVNCGAPETNYYANLAHPDHQSFIESVVPSAFD